VRPPTASAVALVGVRDASDALDLVRSAVPRGVRLLAAEILEYASTRLAKFKTPKSIDFTDSMPRDPNGKLYKRKLRDPYWEGREKI